MSDGSLLLLAAEVRADVEKTERTVREIEELNLTLLDATALGRTRLYAAAALLETLYTSIEKTLVRCLRQFGWEANGPAWHRDVLEAATLAVEGLRPAVLSDESRQALDGYLAFRHRFRNLYLFDLEGRLMQPLLEAAPEMVARVSLDLRAFAQFARDLARA